MGWTGTRERNGSGQLIGLELDSTPAFFEKLRCKRTRSLLSGKTQKQNLLLLRTSRTLAVFGLLHSPSDGVDHIADVRKMARRKQSRMVEVTWTQSNGQCPGVRVCGPTSSSATWDRHR